MSFPRWFLGFLYSQFLVTPPKPSQSFAGQVVIVTGSNTGLGLEAARHITSLGAQKVILAVRNLSKGDAARKSIEATTGRTGVVEVWSLDLSSYDSVKDFATRATEQLDRVDVLLENAGLMSSTFTQVEQDEMTVTVNVTSTFLLALLMLPKLKETARKCNVVPRLTIVSSDMHFITTFQERKSSNIFDALNDKKTANMSDRYGTTKLMEILLVQHLQALLDSSVKGKGSIIINTLTPGFCISDFIREDKGIAFRMFVRLVQAIFARSTEVGSRTLVSAAIRGEETAGKYMADGVVSPVSTFVASQEGSGTRERLWTELLEKLERIKPGISRNL